MRGYVTFNTLIFDHELHEAARAVAQIAAAGADAIIVQDVGIARLAPDRARSGDSRQHADEHHQRRRGRAGQRFGVDRVVLARELSLNDIRAIRLRRIVRWRCLFTVRCACPIRANAFLRKPGVGAAPIAVSARRRAVCRMKCWWMTRYGIG